MPSPRTRKSSPADLPGRTTGSGLAEHLEVWVLVRRVLLVLGIADQVHPQALQPPGLDHRPVAPEPDVVVLVAHGHPDRVGAVMGAGLEEHAAFRRLDVPA